MVLQRPTVIDKLYIASTGCLRQTKITQLTCRAMRTKCNNTFAILAFPAISFMLIQYAFALVISPVHQSQTSKDNTHCMQQLIPMSITSAHRLVKNLRGSINISAISTCAILRAFVKPFCILEQMQFRDYIADKVKQHKKPTLRSTIAVISYEHYVCSEDVTPVRHAQVTGKRTLVASTRVYCE